MTAANHISKVAIVGAGGNSGRFMAEALLNTGKHTVTAITRVGSESKLPPGVVAKTVDYKKPETLVEALRGQHALIITLSGHAPPDAESQLITAAGEAGVAWILPNEWGPDTFDEKLVKDVSMFQSKPTARQTIANLGKSSYISVIVGFWYEWLLAVPAAFGIDFAQRRAILFDDGETKICTSTWSQIGRAVAALLSLPIEKLSSNESVSLSQFANSAVYIRSFTVSQRDMLASAYRVTGTTESDWTITKEPSHERHADGLVMAKEGKREGFAKIMCPRVFYPDGCGDFEHDRARGLSNELLALPEEDLDEATKAAIERSKMGQWTDEKSEK